MGLHDEFWTTDEFRAAFESQHIGKVFRAYRHHPRHLQLYGKALNQEVFGRWLGLNQAQVSKHENGRPEQNLATLQNYARILHLPQRLLWFDLPGQTRIVVHDATALNVSSTIDGEDVNRKQFLKSIALLGAGSVLPRPEILEGGSRIASSHLDHLEEVSRQLLSDDQGQGAGRLVSTATTNYSYARTMLDRGEISAAQEGRLVAITAGLAGIAGWLSYDNGNVEDAQQYYADSLFLGQQAHDSEIMVQAMSSMSQLLLHMASKTGYAGYARDSIRTGEGALALARHHESPHLHSLLSTRVARARAHIGDATEARKCIGRAWRELERGIDIPAPEWLDFVTDSEIAFHDAMVRADLGKPETAIELLQASATDTDFARNSLYSRAQLALTFSRHGDLASAEQEAARTTLELRGTRIASKRIHDVLFDVRKATGSRYPDGAWWRQLNDSLSDE